jgi:anti-sigma28 factor (negative regulator of flagellin synthesis)
MTRLPSELRDFLTI